MIKTGERYLACFDNMPKRQPFTIKVLEIAPSANFVLLDMIPWATWVIYDKKTNGFRMRFVDNITISIIERLKKNG